MTPAELASFRALLQAQAAAPKSGGGILSRLRPAPRRELETVAMPAPEPASTVVVHAFAALTSAPPAPQPAPAAATWAPDFADPLPRTPPAFGRRDEEALRAEPDPEPQAEAVAEPAVEVEPVRLLKPPPAWDDAFCTPDEAPPPRTGPAPGVIAGWSRTRPPSAQRRVFQRLEAVFTAEQEGLDARLAAVATSA